jgi:outer membrane protein OmpA-like peptidoglycan-associated protein
MAFIPRFFRVVNLIVDVIDECTGLHVPATVTMKNMRTGKTNKDSLDQNKLESSIFISSEDYKGEDSVTYAVTASSQAYGERTINVNIIDPGQTFNRAKQDSNLTVRKTIMLGRRPVLGAEVAASELSKRRNDAFRGLVLEERATVFLYPLLPYIFFDLNSDQFASRYTLFRSSSQTQGFNDERLPGATLQKYHHVLNIYGYRLTKYPNVKVEITGCVDETNENKNSPLPMKRAELVRDYLKSIWKISDDRITVKATGWPKERSNPRDSLGIVENRRAEIRFSGDAEDVWQVSKPILDNDPTLFPSPETMTWTMKNGIDSSIVAGRRIEIWRHGQPWKVLDNIGNSSATAVWDWKNNDDEYPQEKEGTADEQSLTPYSAQFVVVSKNGTECRSDTVKVPVKRISTKAIATKTDEQAGSTQEKYNLILFDFDSFNPGDMNKRILKEFVYPRVKPSTTIHVEGHTDVVGMFDHNKRLSENRAKTTKDLINGGAGAYKLLDSRGTGEEEPLYGNELPEQRFFNRTVQVILETPLADADIDR